MSRGVRRGPARISTESDVIDAPQLRRAKIAVTAAFITHAVVFSSWVAHIPHVKSQLGLSNAALGTALFGAPLGSVAAMIASHWALPRWGSHKLVPVMIVGYALAAPAAGLAWSGCSLFVALALWGLFQGGLDVTMNTQAAVVERLARAPIMPRFHGMWSAGALLGALIGAACVSVNIGLIPQLVVIGAVVLLVMQPLTRNLAPEPTEPAPAAADLPSARRSRPPWMTTSVAVLAAVTFASMTCEGAAADWSANYLRNVVGAGPGVSGLSYAAYALMMVITRLGAMRLRMRASIRQLLPALALVAAAVMTLTLATANPVIGVLGFASLGAGVALLVPTAFSAAYTAGGAGSAIASVAATGWCGYLLGPPLIGHLAEKVGLSAALATVPVMISIAAVVIRYTSAFDAAHDLT